jgi:NAD-dependent deacetylase
MENYLEIEQLVKDKGNIVAFTSAGISVDSNVPSFRGDQGQWEKYDPKEYADIRSFIKEPAKLWNMPMEMTQLIFDAKPSPAHLALGALEKAGFLNAIVTQNVDGLH